MIKTTTIELIEKWAKDCKKNNKSLSSAFSTENFKNFVQFHLSAMESSRLVIDFEDSIELQNILLNAWVKDFTIEDDNLPDYMVEWLLLNKKSGNTFAQVFRRFRFQSFIHKGFKDIPVPEATAAYMNKNIQVLMAKLWLGLISE